MKYIVLQFLLCLLLSGIATHHLKAQSLPSNTVYAVKVKGLTSAARDAIARELSRDENIRLVYACVPAGILVFGGSDRTDRTALKDLAMPSLSRGDRMHAIQDTDLDLAQAEALCDQARNR